MKCEKAMALFLKNERRLPVMLKLHLLRCPRCKKETRHISAVVGSTYNNTAFVIPRDIQSSVMTQVIHSGVRYGNAVSDFNWVLAGCVIFSSAFLLTYSYPVAWLESAMGDSLTLPLGIFFGAAITLYATIFIGSRLERLARLRQIKWRR
jgi:hypothetical protein